MNLMYAAKGEWIKLRTTASFWWISGLAVLIGAGVAAGTGAMTSQLGRAAADSAAALAAPVSAEMPGLENSTLGTASVGVLVVSVLAVMIFTTEYRYGLHVSTLMATPNRIRMVASKWLVMALVSAIVTLLAVLASYLVFGGILAIRGPAPAAVGVEALGPIWKLPLAAVLAATFAMGIAMLIRNTAGTLVLLLVWTFGEPIASQLPWEVIRNAAPYLPLQHFTAFATGDEVMIVSWSADQSGLYFAAWAIVVFLLGLIVTDRRDA